MKRLLLACWLILPGLAQPASAPVTVSLNDMADLYDAEALGRLWLDERGDASVEQVATPQGLARFQPATPEAIRTLRPDSALWLHYRLVRQREQRHGWLLEFPMPVLDRVTVYQRRGAQWVAESAGDTLAVDEWPEAGRHPHFHLQLPPGEPRDVLVRIRHSSAANVPVKLVSEPAHHQRIQVEYLALGLTFGALLLLIAVCFTQSWVYRDRVYAWYAAYALVTTLAVSAFTGVAAHLLWPHFGALADAPQAMLAYCAGAAALLFVNNLLGEGVRRPRLGTAVLVLGVLGFTMGALHPALPRPVNIIAIAAYLVVVMATTVGMALSAWRRGDPVGAWVCAAYVPLLLAVGTMVLRITGVVPVAFATQYAVVTAITIQVPMLLVALSIRSRERHGAQIREEALATQDALTGLLAPLLFHDRLRQVVARWRRDKQVAAVIYIELVNYPRIKLHYGSAVAEQSLLRSVIKLRRVLRDTDTASRIGESRFGVIMEGVASRTTVTDRAARLIAAGLMPLKGLKPEVTLQFHVAAALLGEHVIEAEEISEALGDLLGSMSPRTRRPIRFLKPPELRANSKEDSSLVGDLNAVPALPARPPLTVVRS